MVRMANLSSEGKARRREQNRQAQAVYRHKKLAVGLAQAPVYVALDSRPDFWVIGHAYGYRPELQFEANAGCLRDPKTGRLRSPLHYVAEAEGRPLPSKRKRGK